tara:strand:+ start:382 stop:669 length:288 start_codon:yes stop_codon:yes gene_type:complete
MISELILSELSDCAVILEGYDDCIIGIGSIFPHTHSVLIYDVGKIINSLMEKDGMDDEEAHEFYAFNIAGAYMGDGTPILQSDKIVDGDIEMQPL